MATRFRFLYSQKNQLSFTNLTTWNYVPTTFIHYSIFKRAKFVEINNALCIIN
jgi:hypothetical protein